jgi:hypothetical protein
MRETPRHVRRLCAAAPEELDAELGKHLAGYAGWRRLRRPKSTISRSETLAGDG